MKYKLFFLLLSFQGTLLFISAQEKYRQTYRVAYDYTEINHFDKKETKDLFYLDISPSVNRFMSAHRLRQKTIKEAGIKAGKNLYEILDDLKKYPNGTMEEVYTDLQLKRNWVCSFFMDNVRYVAPQPQIKWQPVEQEHTVLGYACKEARTNLYGREWVAYYTEDIPLPYGPWKLGGLPGLITEAFSTDSCYHFIMTGFETIQTNEEIHLPSKKATEMSDYQDISRQEYLKAHYLHKVAPQAMKKKIGIGTTYNPDPVSYQKYQKRQKERYQYIEKE